MAVVTNVNNADFEVCWPTPVEMRSSHALLERNR